MLLANLKKNLTSSNKFAIYFILFVIIAIILSLVGFFVSNGAFKTNNKLDETSTLVNGKLFLEADFSKLAGKTFSLESDSINMTGKVQFSEVKQTNSKSGRNYVSARYVLFVTDNLPNNYNCYNDLGGCTVDFALVNYNYVLYWGQDYNSNIGNVGEAIQPWCASEFPTDYFIPMSQRPYTCAQSKETNWEVPTANRFIVDFESYIYDPESFLTNYSYLTLVDASKAWQKDNNDFGTYSIDHDKAISQNLKVRSYNLSYVGLS